MVYSYDEKEQLDRVISVFAEYIRNSPMADLLYSEKVGYVFITIINKKGITAESEAVKNAEELCELLFNELLLDYCVELSEADRDPDIMNEEERAELQKRFEPYMTRLPEYAVIAEKLINR